MRKKNILLELDLIERRTKSISWINEIALPKSMSHEEFRDDLRTISDWKKLEKTNTKRLKEISIILNEFWQFLDQFSVEQRMRSLFQRAKRFPFCDCKLL